MADVPVPASSDGASNVGAKRAAAVLLGLGPDVAELVFQNFSMEDMRAIAYGAKSLRTAPSSFIQKCLDSFVGAMESFDTDQLLGDNIMRDLLQKTYGEEMTKRILGDRPKVNQDAYLDPLRLADPVDVALLLSKEQPQTIAMLLSALGETHAQRIISQLPVDMRALIVQRLAQVSSVSPEILEDVGRQLVNEIDSMSNGGKRRPVDGRGVALSILRNFTPDAQQQTITRIEEENPDLAESLRSNLFVFDDLATLSDRDVQTLLKEFDPNLLPKALKGATPGVRQKLLGNMSGRAAQMLIDDMEAMGPVRMADVEEAQKSLVRIVMDLAEQQRITMVRPTDRMV